MNKFYYSLFVFLFFFVANAQIINIPDANFKAKLLSHFDGIASTQTPDATGNVNSFNIIDTNGDGEIQVSEASLIKYLAVNSSKITNLEGINDFVNLQALKCDLNQITSLNLSGLTNLKYLGCFKNQLTSLNVTGLSNLLQLGCGENQLTSLNVSGLTNLQYLNFIGNQLTSLDVSGLTNLQNLECWGNQLKSLDVSGLSNLEYLSCYKNQLTSLDVSGLTNLKYLGCSDNKLTSLFIKNGTPYWKQLFFQNNLDLAYICANDSDLTLVQDKINSYGYSATCQVNSYCSFNPGGVFYTINGNNKLDENNNGCDASDGFYPNLKYNITDGTVSGSLISNASGNYSIPVSAGTHIITPQLENPSYFNVTPLNATITFPTTTSPFIQDFCITPNGVHHDLEVVIIPLEPARPGFDATYKIKYKNKGNVLETATLVFNFDDAVLDYISSTLAPTTQSTGKLSWNIGALAPFESSEILVTLNVNSQKETPAINDGDVLSYSTTFNSLETDETPVDNTFLLNQTVVNSFDPNDKTCLEGNTIDPRMIGEFVYYKIRFENTGTYAAQNIVVKDVIDSTKFDISTLQMTDASHSCVTRINDSDAVEFIFENINLPFDDATNDGYVVFKIKTKPTLNVGDIISNAANIYFDYNFPIVTNTETSTFQVLANKKFNLDNYISLSPNPAKDLLNITSQDFENVKSISIYNMLGKLIQTTANPNKSINVSHLRTGNYIIKLITEKGEISKKFIKE